MFRLEQISKRRKNERARGSISLRNGGDLGFGTLSGRRSRRDASGTTATHTDSDVRQVSHRAQRAGAPTTAAATTSSETPRAVTARGAPEKRQTSVRIFSTVVHRLAQASRANLVDAADGKIYFARRLNRKIEDLTVRSGLSEFLNVFAVLSVTGKLEDFTRRRRLRKSLTAIAESS
jgi:hypothetical protein